MGGLSPRVRGNHRRDDPPLRIRRSIPAGAGEPTSGCTMGGIAKVYPRGCGGTVLEGPVTPFFSEVYPRGCGGTRRTAPGSRSGRGLSPRVRGNHLGPGRCGLQPGSIPAGAGEPSSWRRSRPRTGVYPRGCGGTIMEFPVEHQLPGLSPRVRGNRRDGPSRTLDGGSIPAGAGEPNRGGRGDQPPAVYPRGCGGTWMPLTDALRASGLSPRVRGNPNPSRHPDAAAGSIPAGAGEPLSRVVPPERGQGLSPRVRGNPEQGVFSYWVVQVYPRGCGGTVCRIDSRAERPGLSPRGAGEPVWPWSAW